MPGPVDEDLLQCFVDKPAVESFLGCEPTYVEERLDDRDLVSLNLEDSPATPDAVSVLLLAGQHDLSPLPSLTS